MRIAGLQKLTLLDYPDHTAATVFVSGCNFRCPFCHNAELVLGADECETLDEREIFAFLEKRTHLLDGVCITGGEPTLQPDLLEFCLRMRRLGFDVKLDTNASALQVLESLVRAGALDYVAIDLKNTRMSYARTCGIDDNAFDSVMESIRLLAENGVSYELRTTVVRELHSENDLLEMARHVPPSCNWFLQNFRDAKNVIAGEGALHPWDADSLETLAARLSEVSHANVTVRG